MARAKSLVENLCDKRGNSSYAREHKMCESLHVYSEAFNKAKAQSWFVSLPPMITFRGKFTFNIEGFGDHVHFSPDTMADFISIVQSLNYELEPKLVEIDPDDSPEMIEWDESRNEMLRKLIQ